MTDWEFESLLDDAVEVPLSDSEIEKMIPKEKALQE